MARLLYGAPTIYGTTPWGTGVWGSGDILLPDALLLTNNNQDIKADTWSLLFADGSASAGDEVKGRQAVLEGTFGALDRAAFRQLCDELRYTCSQPNLKLQLVPGGGYLNLGRLLGVDEDPERLMDWTVAKCRITWQCDDPFWYAEQMQTVTFNLTGNTTLTVEAGRNVGLPECWRGVHPLITVVSPGFLTVNTFTLRNVTDGGLQLRYSDPQLKNGKSATIDCIAGTATRDDGTNTLRYMEGEFLRLLTKRNTLEYEGTSCTLTISWRPRWL